MVMRQPTFLSLAALLLVAGCTPGPVARPLPPADAPSVEEARAWMETQRLSWPNRIDGQRLVNVTTSTTPEAAHAPTGAVCRFWYRNGQIRHVFEDGRHFECSTMLGWVSVSTRIDFRETPEEVQRAPNHYWNFLNHAREDIAAIVSAQVDRTMNDRPPGISRTPAVRGSWTAPDGRVFRYATADVIYPSGGPSGGEPRGLRRVTVIAAGDDWIVSYMVNGPILYRHAVETIHAEGLSRLLDSLGRGPVTSS
jgi:hypothetical protein